MNGADIMKCPFRKGDNGEFKECYGKECVAYFEYEQYSYNGFGPNSNIANATPEKNIIPFCRLTNQYPYYPATYYGL